DGHGFGPAEKKVRTGEQEDTRKDNRPYRIDMRNRIESDSPKHPGGGVPQFLRNPAVRNFVENNSEQQRNYGKDDSLNVMHRSPKPPRFVRLKRGYISIYLFPPAQFAIFALSGGWDPVFA